MEIHRAFLPELLRPPIHLTYFMPTFTTGVSMHVEDRLSLTALKGVARAEQDVDSPSECRWSSWLLTRRYRSGDCLIIKFLAACLSALGSAVQCSCPGGFAGQGWPREAASVDTRRASTFEPMARCWPATRGRRQHIARQRHPTQLGLGIWQGAFSGWLATFAGLVDAH